MALFVDVQYNRVGDSNILKELAIINIHEKFSHYIFRPPYSYNKLSKKDKKQLRWLQYNHSDLGWEDGDFPYSSIQSILERELSKSSQVYVKGLVKQVWLEDYNINAINIEDLGCDFQIKNLTGNLSCQKHHGVCALRNVFHMVKWFKEMCF